MLLRQRLKQSESSFEGTPSICKASCNGKRKTQATERSAVQEQYSSEKNGNSVMSSDALLTSSSRGQRQAAASASVKTKKAKENPGSRRWSAEGTVLPFSSGRVWSSNICSSFSLSITDLSITAINQSLFVQNCNPRKFLITTQSKNLRHSARL